MKLQIAFSKFLLSIVCLTALASCKKDNLTNIQDGSPNSSDGNRLTGSTRSLAPVLFYSFNSSNNMSVDKLAYTNTLTNQSNYNFNNLSNTFFHLYSYGTNELIGISDDPKDVLVTYNVISKQAGMETKTFPDDNLVRKIVKWDNVKKELCYLEGNEGNTGFTILKRCKSDGTGLTTLYASASNDILDGVVVNDKFYYTNGNQLLEVTLANKAKKVVIYNFNLAGAKKFAGFKETKLLNNTTWETVWQVQRIPRTIDQSRVSLFDIDVVRNKVIWLRDNANFVKKVPAEHPNLKYQ